MTKHMEQGLEFDTQLTKTPENVTCAGLSNMDERRAALDALAPWIDKYKTGPLFEDDKGRVLILKKHLYNFIECYELAQNIREALQSPRVPVIEGLEEALNKYSFDMPDISDYETVGEYLDDEAEYRKASSIVEKAARAYAELQKVNVK